MKKTILLLIIVFVFFSHSVLATSIRDGIEIDFVTIGNAGNAPDTDGSPGRGDVSYVYRIGKYEITNAQWNIFTASVGAPTGNYVNGIDPYNMNSYWTGDQQPANYISWYEAIQFCNYLTSGDKSKGVYQFSGTNTNPGDFIGIDRDSAKTIYETIYFLPTEDEWYKAAYYKPDGSGYSSFSNGLSTIPDADNGWNYDGGVYASPWEVGNGTIEQNGTFDIMGNVWEWNETLIYTYYRGFRGGSYRSYFSDMWSSYGATSFYSIYPMEEYYDIGFRVASIPEPASLLLLGLGGLALRSKG